MDENTYTINFTSFAYGGEALGRLPDGRAVFVPFALPGETGRVRLVEEKRGHARGELVEIITAASQRVAPRCVHFGVCGGCHYQNMPYPAQVEAKTAILREQLERIGGMAKPPVQPAVAAPEATHYRNHVQFHLTPEGKLGYHQARSNEVLAIQECWLPEPVLNTVWPQLDFEALPELERIGLRVGSGDDIQLILESRELQPPEFSVEELDLSAIHVTPSGSLVLAGSEATIIEVSGRPFQVSAASFFQVNTRMAEAMVQHVLENLPNYTHLTSHSTVIDGYCGVGLFSAFLARQVGRLIGIEASPSAAEDFVANLDEFDNVELYEATAGQVLPSLDVRPDLVLVDPPRAGLERPAMDGLLALAPPVLVYISCDPSTLARDAKRLAVGGYRLEQVTPFDVFPQTYHIESVSWWRK